MILIEPTQFLVKGWRTPNEDARVTINDRHVTLHLRYCDHSPTGVEFGYNGSGPAQLAFEILFAYLTRVAGFSASYAAYHATAWHQQFKNEYIAPLPRFEKWEINGEQIDKFLVGKVD